MNIIIDIMDYTNVLDFCKMNLRCHMNNLISIHNKNIQLTEEELGALNYLEQALPHLVSYFKNELLIARDKISQRLITSLYRENLVNAQSNSLIMWSNDIEDCPIDGQHQMMRVYFPQEDKYIFARITGKHAFGRVDVEGPFYYRAKHSNQFCRILHPNEILASILKEKPALDNEASSQFKDDMENSVANMALALAYQAYEMQHANEPLLDIIFNEQDSYLRSEQAVIEGHPLHPGAKLRKGLNANENIKYSSEYNKEINLKCVLIHQSIAKTETLSLTYNDELKSHFPELYQRIENECTGFSNLDDYDLMIVHPWQFHNILLHQYEEELKHHLMIPLNVELPYYAGLSFRTLMPKYPVTLPHIKLSTNVHITGEIRTLSEQTTHNGPLVTRILNDILEQDADFTYYRTGILNEFAGIHFYNSNDAEAIQTDRSEQLGTLFRDNIYNLIDNDSVPIIPSSLVTTYKNNEEPPIISLIQRYKTNYVKDSLDVAAHEWLTDYISQLLGIVMPLYVKYGIALEAHLQNSIATFNTDGRLRTIYIRDFEGLRIDEQQLNEAGYVTEHFHEKSRILTDSKTTVFNKVFYSTVQNHIGELILTVSKFIDDDKFEATLWNSVGNIIHHILNQLTNVDTNRISQIKKVMFDEVIDYKCVTTMRLEDEAHHYTYIKVSNPLHK